MVTRLYVCRIACNPVLTRNPDHYLDVDVVGMERECHHLVGFLHGISFRTASCSIWFGRHAQNKPSTSWGWKVGAGSRLREAAAP